MTLTKAELIDAVYEKVGFSKKEAADLVELVFESMKEELCKGAAIKISGFGKFRVRAKKSRMGRNPQTGEATGDLGPGKVLTFTPSRILFETVSTENRRRFRAPFPTRTTTTTTKTNRSGKRSPGGITSQSVHSDFSFSGTLASVRLLRGHLFLCRLRATRYRRDADPLSAAARERRRVAARQASRVFSGRVSQYRRTPTPVECLSGSRARSLRAAVRF